MMMSCFCCDGQYRFDHAEGRHCETTGLYKLISINAISNLCCQIGEHVTTGGRVDAGMRFKLSAQ